MTELAVRQLTPDEARTLTDEVKRDAERLWAKLLELYEGGAHLTLGYSSWGDYFETEFGQHRRSGYKLLEAARVAELVPQGAPVPNGRQARELAPLLDQPAQLREAWTETVEKTNGHPTAAAVREVVRPKLPGPKTAERIARETGRPVVGSDGLIHTGVPEPPGEWIIPSEIVRLVAEMPPADELYVPDFAEASLREEIAAIEAWVIDIRRRFPA